MNGFTLGALLTLLGLATADPASADPAAPARLDEAPPATCVLGDPVTDPPAYYRIELVPTGRIPGTGQAVAMTELSFARSPFGIALTPDGTYIYDLQLSIDGMKPPRSGELVAWITTPNLDEIRKLGALDEAYRISGQVHWNKYLVVVTLEEDADVDMWSGPIVFRGMSRSGLMHTMAGHGPFEQEPCATYGY